MRSTILAFCAVLPTFGAAHAFDIASTFQFPPAGMMPQRHEPLEASPTAKTQHTGAYSRVSLGAKPGRLTSRRLLGFLPLSAADSGRSSFGLSSAASMAIGGGERPANRPCGGTRND